MIENIIGLLARRSFARTVNFENHCTPVLPVCPDERPRLLYLHVPFCERLCPYCSFHRVSREENLCRAYFRALRREIRLYHERGFTFRALYVGGGTPTVMVDELGATLELVRELFPVREISVETNPNHLDEATIGALKKMGVNRLSVGVQSFQDPLLKQMDRFEKYGSGAAISARLKEISGIFDTLNVDMIFNFPSQTPRLLAEDLKTLLEIRVDQVTYYPLMLSAYTRDGMEKTLGQVSRKQEGDLYRQIVSTLEPAYGRSSAWCFSLAGSKSIIDEYIVDYDEYAGLGSGAIGYLGGACYANSFDISHYIAELDQGRLPLLARRDFGAVELMRYHWLMKLFGMKTSLGNLFSPVRRLVYPILLLDMAFFFLVGALGYGKGEIYLTRRGAYLWVVMMREFFTAVNNFRDYCRSPKS